MVRNQMPNVRIVGERMLPIGFLTPAPHSFKIRVSFKVPPCSSPFGNGSTYSAFVRINFNSSQSY